MGKHFSDDAKRRIAKTVRKSENFGGDKTAPNGRRGDREMPQTTFAVRCTVDGGSGGSTITNCTFTYTVKNFAGDITFGTLLSPEDERQANTKYWAQGENGVGLGCYDQDGNFMLITAFEELEVGDVCGS